MFGTARALGIPLCCAVMLLCAALPSAAQEPASALRNRLVRRPKATKTPGEEAAVFAARGDACRAQGDRDCACDAYLEALRIDANASAVAGADALQCDPFSRAYDFAPALSAADEFYPGERSGIVLAIGLGNQFSGIGAHAAWYARVARTPFWIAPYAGGGMLTLGGDYGLTLGPIAGVMAMWGLDDRWVLDASFGGLGTIRLELYGETVATRTVHGATLSAGYEWMARHGTLFRLLFGAAIMTDAGSAYDFDDRVVIAVTLAFGWKP